MLLTAREAQGLVPQLAAAKIPIKLIKINPAKQTPIGPALQALLSKSVELKDWAQRALVAYVRSVFLAPNKAVFDAQSLALAELATSWGLLAPPRMRFLKQVGKKKVVVVDVGGEGALGEDRVEDGEAGQQGGKADKKGEEKNKGKEVEEEEESEEEDGSGDEAGSEDEEEGDAAAGKKQAAKGKAAKGGEAAGKKGGKKSKAGADSEEDDFLVVKKKNVFEEDEGAGAQDGGDLGSDDGDDVMGAADAGKLPKKKKLKIKVGSTSGQRVVFDNEGQAMDPLAALAAEGLEYEEEEEGEEGEEGRPKAR